MRVLLAVAVVGLVASAASAATSTPRVALVRAVPATIAGHGYEAGARISVSYASGANRVRRTVTTSRTGAFTVALRNVTFRRCDGLVLAAGAAAVHVGSCAVAGAPVVTADPGGLVAGARFVPGERVTLRARAAGAVTERDVTAGESGSFQARVPAAQAACAEVYLQASGSLGSRATFTVHAPTCMAP